MIKQFWQSEDRKVIFDNQEACEEYERNKDVLHALSLDISLATENLNNDEAVWGFKEGFFLSFQSQWNEVSLIKHKEDFRRLLEFLDCKLSCPTKKIPSEIFK